MMISAKDFQLNQKTLPIVLIVFTIFTISLSGNLPTAHAAAATVSAAGVTSSTTVQIVFTVPVDWVIGDFTDLNVNGEARTIDSISQTAPSNTVTITFSGGAAVGTDATGDIDIAAIADGGSGNTFAGETNQALADIQLPSPVSAATASTTTIDITFDEAITNTGAVNGDFAIGGVAGGTTISNIAVLGSVVTITTTGTMLNGETITVTYTQGGNGLEDGAANDVSTFGPLAVTNNIAAPTPEPERKGGGGCNGDCEHPTLGVNDHGRRLVDNGFTYNGNPINVEHFFTPYPLVTVDVGMPNLAEFKIYDNSGADKIYHFELAFGIGKGNSIDTNQAMIIWDKTFDGIETTELDDPDNVLDKVRVNTSEVLCQEDSSQMCLLVKVAHIFRAPLEFNVLGTNVWDAKRNSIQNFYNHGIEVEGESMNPRLTKVIPGTDKYEGLITVAQSELYSNLYVAKDGRVFEFFGPNDSFRLINSDMIVRDDPGVMKDRYHSSFNEYKDFQAELATSIFDSSSIQGENPVFFAYDYPDVDSRTQFLIDNGLLDLIR